MKSFYNNFLGLIWIDRNRFGGNLNRGQMIKRGEMMNEEEKRGREEKKINENKKDMNLETKI